MIRFLVVLLITAAWGWLIKHNGGTGTDIFIGALGAFVFCAYVAFGNWRKR